MYLSLFFVYPFDPFLSFFQSTITPILLNPYISNHLNSTLIHIYFLFYLPPIHESPCLYPSLSLAYPRLSFSILWQSRILLFEFEFKILAFLNLYLLINVNPFLSFSNINYLYPFESQSLYPNHPNLSPISFDLSRYAAFHFSQEK